MKLQNLYRAFIIFLLAVSCSSVDKPDPEFAVMAYYFSSRDNYNPEDLPLDKLSHIIYSFTVVIDNEMRFSNESHYERLKLLAKQKENFPDLKVMVACGGWGGSGGFSEMAATNENRNSFVNSTVRLIEDYDLDGVDIDWEYPGLPGDNNPHGPEDKENFTLLMKELREAMDATGKKLVLTFASAGWERYYDFVELDKVMKYADYMNVMTYDFATGGSPFTAHHTNLGLLTSEAIIGTPAGNFLLEERPDFIPRSTEGIIRFCLDKGVDSKQLVIGGAFYGRAWSGVPPENKGLYQPTKGVWRGSTSYMNMSENLINQNGFIRYWDPIAKAPYLYNEVDSVFISYDDTASIKLKTKYAVDNQLGGIMFWQLSHDAPAYNLVNAINQEVKYPK